MSCQKCGGAGGLEKGSACPACFRHYCGKCQDSEIFAWSPLDNKIFCDGCFSEKYDCSKRNDHTCGGDKCLLIATNQPTNESGTDFFERGSCCVTIGEATYCSGCYAARSKRRNEYQKEINTPMSSPEEFEQELRNLRPLFCKALQDNPYNNDNTCLIPKQLKRIEREVDVLVYDEHDANRDDAAKALKRAKIQLQTIWKHDEDELIKEFL